MFSSSSFICIAHLQQRPGWPKCFTEEKIYTTYTETDHTQIEYNPVKIGYIIVVDNLIQPDKTFKRPDHSSQYTKEIKYV